MKLRTLVLLLILAASAYLAYEVVQDRNPLDRLTALLNPGTPAPVPARVDETLAATTPDENALILSAPPRESVVDGNKRFGPMAEYLTQVLGRKVIYRHPGTWGGYQSDMQRDEYDLVFDGPHFVSWRIDKHRHHALVKLPGEFRYIGFVRADNTEINGIDDFSGQPVCVHAPPNLGTLMLLSEFDNPSRQPSIVITKGYDKIFKGVLEGRCVAAMLPRKHLQKHDKDGTQTRVVYEHRPAPEQALTAGWRISPSLREKIVNALVSQSAEAKLVSFREAYALGGWFVYADNKEYDGLGAYLKPVQGFYK